jgi:two-component system, NarL family, response regulator YdfI
MDSDSVIRILVVASTAVMRTHLEALATTRASRVTSSTGVSRGSLRRQLDESRPDVVLVEVGASELRPVLRELTRAGDPPATIVVTDDPRRAWGPARRAGVRAVLPRSVTAAEVTAAIDAAAAGLIVLHPDALDRSRSDQDAATPALRGETTSALTAREIQILGMMAEGLGNKIIAARLKISEHTVKFHISSIFAKLGASSRTEAVTIGIRRGLILI